MTPTRALVGLAAVAAAGYVVIHSVGGPGPQYIGDFPSIQEQSQAEAPPAHPRHRRAAAPATRSTTRRSRSPRRPHPRRRPDRRARVRSRPRAPGGGGTGGRADSRSPAPGNPLGDGLTPLTDLLSGLLGTLPKLDAQGFCRLASGQVVALPCDQVPALPAMPTLEMPAPLAHLRRGRPRDGDRDPPTY